MINKLHTVIEEEKSDLTTDYKKRRNTPIFQSTESNLKIIYSSPVDADRNVVLNLGETDTLRRSE